MIEPLCGHHVCHRCNPVPQINDARRGGLGPIAGAAMQHIHIEDGPTAPSAPTIALLTAVVSANPDYLPEIAAGAITPHAWHTRKQPERVFLAYAPGGELADHAALRLKGAHPDRTLLPRPLAWELSMIFVRPCYRGCGIVRKIAEHITAEVRPTALWASVRQDSPGSTVAHRIGWDTLTEQDFAWADGRTGRIWVPKAQ